MSVAPAFQKVLLCCTINDHTTEGSKALDDTLARKDIKAYVPHFPLKNLRKFSTSSHLN